MSSLKKKLSELLLNKQATQMIQVMNTKFKLQPLHSTLRKRRKLI